MHGDFRKALKIWFYGVLCVVLVNVLRCRNIIPQPTPQDTVHIKIVPLNGYAGMTVCDKLGRPVILISDTYEQGSPIFNALLAHEKTHVVQMRRMGGCLFTTHLYRNHAQVRFEMETEAYCVQLLYVKEEYRPSVASHFADFIVLRYKTKKTDTEAYAYIKQVCAEIHGDTLSRR